MDASVLEFQNTQRLQSIKRLSLVQIIIYKMFTFSVFLCTLFTLYKHAYQYLATSPFVWFSVGLDLSYFIQKISKLLTDLRNIKWLRENSNSIVLLFPKSKIKTKYSLCINRPEIYTNAFVYGSMSHGHNE